jgi:hypothetical protein
MLKILFYSCHIIILYCCLFYLNVYLKLLYLITCNQELKKIIIVSKLIEIIKYLSIHSENRFIFLIILILTICIFSLSDDMSYN